MARSTKGALALTLILALIGLPQLTGTVAVAPAGAAAGAQQSADEAAFVTRMNDLRISRGLARVSADSRLSEVARAWSARMAGAGAISHNPELAAQAPGDWQKLGENVGVGGSVVSLHDALVASPPHLANLVDPRFNAVGVGVVAVGSTIWVTQVFMAAPVASLVLASAPAVASPATGPGWYRLAGASGELYSFGSAAALSGVASSAPVVSIAATPSGAGTWMAAANGSVHAIGDATFLGSADGVALSQPIVGMASTPTGRGYWLVARDGGIFAFGDAPFLGSTGDLRLNQPIVGMTATATGAGYWFVAADGGIFSFGDARFLGSTGDLRLNQPVVGMASDPSTPGYWLVARDGGIFAFGNAPFLGSTGDLRLNQPIVGLAPTSSGAGYRFVAADGGIFSFGDASFLGSVGGARLASPVMAMVAGG